MIKWKYLPGILCQTKDEGKRARQRRDRERVCVRGRALWGEGDGVRRLEKKTWCECENN